MPLPALAAAALPMLGRAAMTVLPRVAASAAPRAAAVGAEGAVAKSGGATAIQSITSGLGRGGTFRNAISTNLKVQGGMSMLGGGDKGSSAPAQPAATLAPSPTPAGPALNLTSSMGS